MPPDPSPGAPAKASRAMLVLAPALVAVAVLWPVLLGGFVHDDWPQILGNPLVRHPEGFLQLWTTGVWAGAGSGSSFYRPLMMSSFALDHALFGGFPPLAFHAVQLAWFAGVVALAGGLVRAVEGPGPRGLATAVLASALFAVHPVNVEAAAWVSARCDLLAMAAGLGALWLYRLALADGAKPRSGWLGGSALLFALALTSKESAAAFLAGGVALDRIAGAPLAPRALARRAGPFVAAAGVYLVLRANALGGLSGGLAGATDWRVALGAVGQGALRLVWPRGLTISPPSPGTLDTALGLCALALGSAALVWAFRRRSSLLLPVLLGGAQLAVAAVGAGRIGELADRYLMGPALCLAWVAARALVGLPARRRRPALVAATAAAAVLALVAHGHTRVFASDEVLWSAAWRANPRSARAALNLSALAINGGDPRTGLVWLERAEALDPGDPRIAFNRAVAANEMGDRARALRGLRELVAADPRDWPSRLTLAHLLLEADAAAEAVSHYEAVVRIHELSAEAWAGLGVARLATGDVDGGRTAIERALLIDPRVQNAAALRELLSGAAGEARPGGPRGPGGRPADGSAR
ncbi:MAG: tetratricopeptide repeat protein [Myxococcota bacterium]